MNNLNKIGLQGQYRLEVKRNGKLIKETDWFDNLITDNGLDYIGNSANYLDHCQLGTGTSVPLVTNTQLDARVGSGTRTTPGGVNAASCTNSGSPNYITSRNYAYTFLQGAVVGNITEIGIGKTSVGDLFSRALITDTNGAPVSITLTSIDQLTIYYKLNIAPPTVDNTGTINISGVDYNYANRFTYVDSFYTGGNIGGVPIFEVVTALATQDNGIQLGTINTRTTGTNERLALSNANYVLGSYKRESTFTAGNNVANFVSGIRGITLYYNYEANGGTAVTDIIFSTPIVKTNTQIFTLNTSVSWGRA